MKNIKNHSIKRKEYLNEQNYKEIKELQDLCVEHDKTSLKLELEYKLKWASVENEEMKEVNEFLYYIDKELVGYIGIGCFGGAMLEVNGMVHPELRRQGIFSSLFQMVKEEWKKRNNHDMLLLCDRNSYSGQEFIKTTGASYDNSEYEMYLNRNYLSEENKGVANPVVFVKATNEDAEEIARQNAIYVPDSQGLIMPEEEEGRGMIIYLAKDEDGIVGKVHLQIETNQSGIYGLGVLPEYRGQGYGRSILRKAIDVLKDIGAEKIMLQVATQNANALNLYKSCGFEETTTMDYFKMMARDMDSF